jgi:hypothetical protein
MLIFSKTIPTQEVFLPHDDIEVLEGRNLCAAMPGYINPNSLLPGAFQ